MSVNLFSTHQQWFSFILLSDPHLPSFHLDFSSTLTTITLNDSRLKWFEACS
jgi:hypothetical protein